MKKFLRNLVARLSKSCQHQRPRGFRPALEALESREVPSATLQGPTGPAHPVTSPSPATAVGGPSAATTTPVQIGSWQEFSWNNAPRAFDSQGAFTFTSKTTTTLQVTDFEIDGDQLKVFDKGKLIGTTSKPANDGTYAGDPDAAFVNPKFSHGTFLLGPGAHSLTFEDVAIPTGFPNGDGFFRVDPKPGPVVTGMRAIVSPTNPFSTHPDPLTHQVSATIDIINSEPFQQSGPFDLVFHLPPGWKVVGAIGSFQGHPVLSVNDFVPANNERLDPSLPPGTLPIVVTFQAPAGFTGTLPLGQIDVRVPS